ncbi:rho GTPase-activating protein 27-like [Trichomycterus rosablanca]|uniref:rho GTPase-activating protein 27-like n=1 Tax=Trichomycterus rosablanca TaxID=2290929 RepID=UPI002F3554B0
MTSLQQEVLVKFQYEYTTRDGKQVSIKPDERYVLVAKNNDHWWYVRKDESTQPFFIPVQYVTVLPPENQPLQLQPPGEFGTDDLPKPHSDTPPPVENPHHDIPRVDVSQGASGSSSSSVEVEGPYAVSPPHFPTVSSHKHQTESEITQPSTRNLQVDTRTEPSTRTLGEDRIYESIDAVKDSDTGS